MYEKKYLNTYVIALCFLFWKFYITIPVGIVLLIMQAIENRKLKEKYNIIDDMENKLHEKETIISSSEDKIEELKTNIAHLTARLNRLRQECDEVTKNIVQEQKRQHQEQIAQEVQEIADSIDYSSYDSLSSEECKNQLALLKQEEKEIVKEGEALQIFQTDTASQKSINNNSKQILRCFNAECDNIILSISIKNIDSLRTKITKSFDAINKIFEVDGVQLTPSMLELKLRELTLLYDFEKKREEEREIQKAIKEQMMEEEKVRKELEKKRQQIEKDEKQFNNEVSKLMKYLQKTDSEVEKQLYADKIAELEAKIKELEAEKDDVINRQENAKAGFVYVISNIGSFGEDVFKIGMTRRLEPMDRIKELSSASVPFEFDVHAMIFSENAPDLESKLHNHFDSYRVNKVNPRKEFFKVSVDEIAEYIDQSYDNTVEFTKIPVARDYRESIAQS